MPFRDRSGRKIMVQILDSNCFRDPITRVSFEVSRSRSKSLSESKYIN